MFSNNPKSMNPRPRKEVDVSTFEGRFAVRLKKLREKAGISQVEAAELVGVSRATYFNWESGSNYPHIKNLAKLAEIMGVTPRNLLPKK